MPDPDDLMSEPYDPIGVTLDLSRDEKLRVTALMLAIQYQTKTICDDAAMYRELTMSGKHLEPATVDRVIDCAAHFACFIAAGPSREQMALPRPEGSNEPNGPEGRPEPAAV